MRVALLSNVNIDPVIRLLDKATEFEIYQTQGYGNELGLLLDKESSLNTFNPDTIFLIIDTMEVIEHNLDVKIAFSKIKEWFELFESSIQKKVMYFISDAYLFGTELEILRDGKLKNCIESQWQISLEKIEEKYTFIYSFPYKELIQKRGEDYCFSLKMWYLGKILHTVEFHNILAAEILHKINLIGRQPKKVLLLDLDNTLWRGLAGEHKNEPIILSDDGVGLAYKNFQRSIRQLQLQGIILGIVSKNNKEDAMDIISNHPHMVLRENDFSIIKINWRKKNENIRDIAEELNIGLDSIVYIDDDRSEQMLIRETMPEVVVPDFPKHPEELTFFIAQIYHDHFEKIDFTEEDKEKTEQYLSNAKRNELKDSSLSFEDYLKKLEMKIIRVEAENNRERFMQLMNKTNQFNLTTLRFTIQDITEILESRNKEVFLYRMVDRFGDNGIVAASIVEYGDEARITEFTMSCRVMGKKIENAIVEDMEKACRERGYKKIIGVYIPSEKNHPVEKLYEALGYTDKHTNTDGSTEYSLQLDRPLNREYYLTRKGE